MKYRPAFPRRFGSIQDSRAFCATFFDWYHHQHRHSGIGYYTLAAVHYGRATILNKLRSEALAAAYAAHVASEDGWVF
jgi:putative transposase